MTTRVLVISHDVVGHQMAGPGIRYYHLARVLAAEFEVTLAVPYQPTEEYFQSTNFQFLTYQSGTDPALEKIIQQTEVAIVPAIWLVEAPALLEANIPLAIDGYNPYLAETLTFQQYDTQALQKRLSTAYSAGDFFMCASERQRDWWLGLLEAHGRINRYTFQQDPSLRQLVDLVPFGLPETPPQHTRQVIRGVWPGIGKDDKLILWGGGLWSWLDPLTAIKAMDQVWQQRQDVKLIFPGTRHPNPIHKEMPSHNQGAKLLAEHHGLLNVGVFFGDWIPYADWPNVLLESDLALSLHFDSFETRLAFRSRVLDYIWAGLPTIATRGDATSDLIANFDFNRLVDYEAVEEVTQAILDLMDIPRQELAPLFTEAREQLSWPQAMQPLIEFCRHPRLAPDKVALKHQLGTPYYIHHRQRLTTELTTLLQRTNQLQLNTAYLTATNQHLVAERDRWHDLVQRYERGRFIRFMRWVKQVERFLFYLYKRVL